MTSTINEFADYWRHGVGVNVIPANTREKKPTVEWKEWQDKPIPEELHNRWKSENRFSNGMAVIAGRVWHNKQRERLYLNCIDADNAKAIQELCFRNGKGSITLQDLARWTLVEQHLDDPTKAHIYIYSNKPFAKKSSDNIITNNIDNNNTEFPLIEVKGLGEHGIMFCSPSIHKNGHCYEILGIRDPVLADDYEHHIDTFLEKYGISYLGNGNGKSDQMPIEELFKQGFKVRGGNNRHENILRVMESLLVRNARILEPDMIKRIAADWNNQHCLPPLNPQEFKRQWKDASKFIAKVSSSGNNKDRVLDSDDWKGKDKNERKDKGGNGGNTNANAAINTNTDRPTVAERLIELTTQNSNSFFKDENNTAFAHIYVRDHHEIVKVTSGKFKRYLSRLYYENEHKVANSEALTNAVQVLQAKGEFEGETKSLSLRLAWYKGDIYYDLTNEKHQCVKVSGSGSWQVSDETPGHMFVRYNQISQVQPSRDYESDIFDRFIGLTNLRKGEGDRILLKVYIVSLFIPDIPHVILQLHGEQGGAKSMLENLIKILVDPAKAPLLSVPNDRMEFIMQLSHNYVAFYDNLKYIPKWLSDESCRAVTGAGSSKRMLYTDDDEIVFQYRRCLGYNGINLILTQPDALDRSISLELDRVADETRKQENEILEQFEDMKSKLLGYIFDILVKSLQIKPTIRLKQLPRMADFALWGEAIARAIGYKDMEFIKAYYKNIKLQAEEAIETQPVSAAITKFMEDKEEKWKGTATELLAELVIVSINSKINTNDKSWPKAPNILSRRINEVKTNLRQVGIEIGTDLMNTKTGLKAITIRNVSSESPVSKVSSENEEKQTRLSDNTNSADEVSSENEVSSDKEDQNHEGITSKFYDTTHSYDSDDISSIKGGDTGTDDG